MSVPGEEEEEEDEEEKPGKDVFFSSRSDSGGQILKDSSRR